MSDVQRGELAALATACLWTLSSLAWTLRRTRPMLILLWGAIVGPFVGVALNMIALRNAPAGVVATIVSTMPVLVLPFSVLLYGDRLTVRAFVGAVVAIAGVAMLVL